MPGQGKISQYRAEAFAWGFCPIYAGGTRRGGSVDEILPRKNALVRPAVANVDQLFIVVSAAKPAADYGLVDKMLIYALHSDLPAVIGINKLDQDKKGVRGRFLSAMRSAAQAL